MEMYILLNLYPRDERSGFTIASRQDVVQMGIHTKQDTHLRDTNYFVSLLSPQVKRITSEEFL